MQNSLHGRRRKRLKEVVVCYNISIVGLHVRYRHSRDYLNTLPHAHTILRELGEMQGGSKNELWDSRSLFSILSL